MAIALSVNDVADILHFAGCRLLTAEIDARQVVFVLCRPTLGTDLRF